ncbi:SPS1 [Scenedesmus sp. PABB004]|nr:SPS1 [Scenedesmus sp. PABB004]
MRASAALRAACALATRAAGGAPGLAPAAASAGQAWSSSLLHQAVLGGGPAHAAQQRRQLGALSSLSSLHGAATALAGGDTQAWEGGAAPGAADPFALVAGEVGIVSERLCESIVSNVPALEAAAEYYFRPGVRGKRLRPTLLLLMASALGGGPPGDALLQPDLRPPHERPREPRRRQQRIAEIAELIHVASLLHDDVLDDAATRRGVSSLNAASGNKLAILAGDFLLARASVTLASLCNVEIVELLSRVLEHLVAGEVMQMSASPEQLTSLPYYMDKTFYKTASLMAHSARAVALLGDAPPGVADAAWRYGRHLGLAFQVVDDLLDITGTATELGKPALSDMRAGLATAPVLLALDEQPGLVPLVRRKFRGDGDVPAALELVRGSSGVPRAKALAAEHARAAAEQVAALPPTSCAHALEARAALVAITQRVLVRTKSPRRFTIQALPRRPELVAMAPRSRACLPVLVLLIAAGGAAAARPLGRGLRQAGGLVGYVPSGCDGLIVQVSPDPAAGASGWLSGPVITGRVSLLNPNTHGIPVARVAVEARSSDGQLYTGAATCDGGGAGAYVPANPIAYEYGRASCGFSVQLSRRVFGASYADGAGSADGAGAGGRLGYIPQPSARPSWSVTAVATIDMSGAQCASAPAPVETSSWWSWLANLIGGSGTGSSGGIGSAAPIGAAAPGAVGAEGGRRRL